MSRIIALVFASLLLQAGLAAAMPTLSRTIAPGAAPFNGLQLALADFRGDRKLEVVAQSDNGSVYIVDPASGATLATFAAGNAGCTSTCYSFEGVSGPINAPVVADVDRNGKLDIIVANTAAVVARFELDPAHSTASRLAFLKVWEHRYNAYQSFTTMDATPIVADLLGNGQLETIVTVEQTGVFAIRPDGSTLWARAIPGGHASPSAADLDGDGKLDIVLAGDQGQVSALAGATGATKWTFAASAYVWPASIPMAPTLADINGDGRPDVLFAARDAHDASNFANDHVVFFALNSWGRLLWNTQPWWAAPLSHTRPIVVTVNGQKAIVGGDWNTIGHSPGSFQRVGPGHVFLLDANGREKWHRDLNAASSNLDLAVADVVGDGTQQVIAAGTSSGAPGLWLFDLASGATKGFLATAQPTRSFAAVADLKGDGKFGMVVAGGSGVIQVWSGSQRVNAAFPGWGAINPPRESVPIPGGGGNATFGATFGPRGNEWWVETSIGTTHAIARVTATLNGGPPQLLPADSWGTWAASLHAPAGTKVRFNATDTDGAIAQSPCYWWINFTIVACPGSGGGGVGGNGTANKTFNATFRLSSSISHWWVEAHVSSNESVAAVTASVNGGAWVALTHQSWGSWAKSFYVSSNATVQFRALSSRGDAALSPNFTWP